MKVAEWRMDSHWRADVLGILQEAFANASRHGQAKRVDAVVKPVGKELELTVDDDGRGFDPQLARRGVGLQSIAERVERRDGSLLVNSAPGQGTRIHAWLPLRPPAPGPR